MPLIDVKPPLQAIFDGLEGEWQLRRSLDSKLPGCPSGAFTGTANFKRHNAFDGSSYLYHETGELVTEQGHRLVANRKYIYRLSPEDEKISVWFVQEPQEDGKEDVDYLYHELEFERKDGRWLARGDHLCNMDMYWSAYDFRMEKDEQGVSSLAYWGLRHLVKGPEKDYSHDSSYQR